MEHPLAAPPCAGLRVSEGKQGAEPVPVRAAQRGDKIFFMVTFLCSYPWVSQMKMTLGWKLGKDFTLQYLLHGICPCAQPCTHCDSAVLHEADQVFTKEGYRPTEAHLFLSSG